MDLDLDIRTAYHNMVAYMTVLERFEAYYSSDKCDFRAGVKMPMKTFLLYGEALFWAYRVDRKKYYELTVKYADIERAYTDMMDELWKECPVQKTREEILQECQIEYVRQLDEEYKAYCEGRS